MQIQAAEDAVKRAVCLTPPWKDEFNNHSKNILFRITFHKAMGTVFQPCVNEL